MLVVVLYLGFSGGDDDVKADPTTQGKKGKKSKRKGKRDKARAGESGGVGVGKMCAKLDCSEAQLASFKGMVKEHRKNTSSQRRGLAEAHAKIAAELAEDAIDTAALDDAFEDATTQRAEMDNSARGVLEAMHAKLSSAQRESLAKMVARHGPSMLLSRPAAGSKRPKSRRKAKSKAKSRSRSSGGGRNKGLTFRDLSGGRKARGGSSEDPAELSGMSKAGSARQPSSAEPAELDEPALTDESEELAAE